MAKWSKPPDELVTLFTKATAPLSNVEPRKMFGFPAVFTNGNMFAGLFQDRLILRLPDPARTAFITTYGAKPFEPMPGRRMREYVEVPPEVLANGRTLAAALAKGRDYAASLPPKANAARSSAKPRGTRPPRTVPAKSAAKSPAAISRPSTRASASSGRAGRKSSRR